MDLDHSDMDLDHSDMDLDHLEVFGIIDREADFRYTSPKFRCTMPHDPEGNANLYLFLLEII
jgi:hypothetical protein